jgi:hypothetical protein
VTRVLRFYHDAPMEWDELPGSGVQRVVSSRAVHRIVQPNGTVVYTNIAFGQSAAVSRGR